MIAFSSFANASRASPVAYNYNTPGYPNANAPYGGNTYPAYPNTPNYPYAGGLGQPSYPYYPPGYTYPYGPSGEREGGPWSGE